MTKSIQILTIEIRMEYDIVQVRQRTRQISRLLGFDNQDQTRIATAISEIARNAYQYAKGGKVEFELDLSAKRTRTGFLSIQVTDHGPGISNLTEVLSGRYVSKTGMGLGLLGAKRLMDEFQIETTSKTGTTVRLAKELPKQVPIHDPKFLNDIFSDLIRPASQTPFQEVQQQNQELLRAMEELKVSQDKLAEAYRELETTNRELAETNRGVVALYTELDEKAEALKKASEIKTRFLSHMSHEFRTPIHSILGLSRLVLEKTDGELTPEQEKQIGFVYRAAQEILDMVNDLLDIAKLEAGKSTFHIKKFDLIELFTTLRALMKPLHTNPRVELVFDEPIGIPTLETDEGKIAQILRNLVSNALKFTEQGTIRITAKASVQSESVVITVSDTGIGIPISQQDEVFEEYTQIDSALQRNVKGTGLGLPLVKKLTLLLGGGYAVESAEGIGSTFTITLPLKFAEHSREIENEEIKEIDRPSYPYLPESQFRLERRELALTVDDDAGSRYLLREKLQKAGYEVIEAETRSKGLELALKEKPSVIFLDLVMPEFSVFEMLEKLRVSPLTRCIPIVVHTSKKLEVAEREQLLQVTGVILPKEDLLFADAMTQIRSAIQKAKNFTTYLDKERKCG